MLLAVDIGNTNIVFGLFEGARLLTHFRLETRKARTEDEYAALLSSLLQLHGLPFRATAAPEPEANELAAGAAPLAPSARSDSTTSGDHGAAEEGGRGKRVVSGAERPGRSDGSDPAHLQPLSAQTGERGISAGILATVVPPVLAAFQRLFQRYLNLDPVIVGPGTRTGMPILYDNPREVGADRIINAVAAYERYRSGCLVVDFGTATTFDVVTPKGEYLGGAIAPGIGISADALFHAAAKLPRVELLRPRSVIGKNTVSSMQSGLVYGYVGLVDGIVERMRAEVDFPLRVVATGGLAALLARDSRTIEDCDEMLTLTGLRIIYDREQRRGPR
ncbi:MAG TPA: type III pantothenate kinase [Pseudomonadota bacterium]|nr:type III pantothenate kinase [Pseudomonadota bacterium]